MTMEMHAHALIETAQHETGLSNLGSDSFLEGLEILVSDINRSPRPAAAFETFRNELVRYLSTRLRVVDWIQRHPAVLNGPVDRPLFVFGIPRTGTTLASNLLAADRNRRSLLTWECQSPVPPPVAAHLYDDERALAALAAERQQLAANPASGKYYRASAIYPTEDVFPMAQDFKSLFWESHGPLPHYGEWLLNCDMRSAYEYHKQYLQLLQSNASGTWNLKMPSHALFLSTLLDVYPDARLIWTHRDPVTATASLCSLIARAHQAYYGAADTQWIGRNYPKQAALHANRIMAARDEIGEDRIFDLHYADLISAPIETMQRLYRWLGDEWTDTAESGMRAWLSANPQGKFGKHEYALGEYGLEEAAVRPLFDDYLSRYDVAQEG